MTDSIRAGGFGPSGTCRTECQVDLLIGYRGRRAGEPSQQSLATQPRGVAPLHRGQSRGVPKPSLWEARTYRSLLLQVRVDHAEATNDNATLAVRHEPRHLR